MLYVPVNNFSVMSGRSHRFLVIPVLFWEVNVSCSRIQHGNLSEDRTPRPLALESDALPLGHGASLQFIVKISMHIQVFAVILFRLILLHLSKFTGSKTFSRMLLGQRILSYNHKTVFSHYRFESGSMIHQSVCHLD